MTTVTIDGDTQDKLGDLKQMLHEMGDPEFFKRDIVRNLVDEMHDDVRDTYYEAQAEPFLRARRYEQHSALLDYWTRDRIITDLFHDGYREEYAEAYGDAGDDRYIQDVRDMLIETHDQLVRWFNLESETPDGSMVPRQILRDDPVVPGRVAETGAVAVETLVDGAAHVWAAPVPGDMLFTPYRRGIGNACEIAFRRTKQRARAVLVAAGREDVVDNPRMDAHLFVTAPTIPEAADDA